MVGAVAFDHLVRPSVGKWVSIGDDDLLFDHGRVPGAIGNVPGNLGVAYAMLTDAFRYEDQYNPKSALDIARRACAIAENKKNPDR